MVPKSLRALLSSLSNETWWLAGLAALLIASTGVFLAISDEVAEQETQTLDGAIVRGLREPHDPSQPRGPEWLPQAARDVTSLGSMSVLTIVVVAVAGYLALSRRTHSLVLVVTSTLGGVLASLLLKRMFARPRPDFVPHLDETVTSSYPSGHAMLSAVVYLTLGALLAQLTPKKRLKSYILLIALLLPFLVGLTRVYLGVHYPTDVLGGWSAGAAWAVMSALLARLLRRRSPELQEEASSTAPLRREA